MKKRLFCYWVWSQVLFAIGAAHALPVASSYGAIDVDSFSVSGYTASLGESVEGSITLFDSGGLMSTSASGDSTTVASLSGVNTFGDFGLVDDVVLSASSLSTLSGNTGESGAQAEFLWSSAFEIFDWTKVALSLPYALIASAAIDNPTESASSSAFIELALFDENFSLIDSVGDSVLANLSAADFIDFDESFGELSLFDNALDSGIYYAVASISTNAFASNFPGASVPLPAPFLLLTLGLSLIGLFRFTNAFKQTRSVQ